MKTLLTIPKLNIDIILHYDYNKGTFKVEYDFKCGYDEETIRKEVELIINKTLKTIT